MSASVVIMDNNGNELYRFGEYGNPDEPGSTAEPGKILMGYPMYVRNHDKNVYISDVGNQRVVHVSLSFDQEWTNGAAAERTARPAAALSMKLYPSPFNPGLNAEIRLPAAGPVRISLFAPDGRRIRMIRRHFTCAGNHTIRLLARSDGGTEIASGVYLVRLEAGGKTLSRHVVHLK
jgi:hypothetical protein